MIKNLSEATILKLVVFLPILATILTSIILTNIFISTEKKAFKAEVKKIEENHIQNLKALVKERINKTVELIQINNKAHVQTSKKELKNFVDMSYKIAESLHQEYKHVSKKYVINEIRSHLRKIRFYDNQSGYFYIYDMQGNNILLPIKPQLEGTNQLNLQDIKGTYLTKEAIEKLQTQNEAFSTYYWPKSTNEKITKKLGFYKLYAPLDIFIGTGKYYDDIYMENIQSTIHLLQSIKYDEHNYIFAINDEGTPVVHPNKKIYNKPFKTLSTIEQKIVQQILDQRVHKDGAFLEYKPTTQSNEKNPSYKISFVKYIPEIKMIIGTGLYTNEWLSKVEEKQTTLKEKLDDTVSKIIVISFVVTSFLIFIMVLISSSLRDILNNYAQVLSKKNSDLEELNNNLEKRVEEEVEKNRKQDDILNQQAKMAAMGEMLGNISHQWRQPLSAISTSASSIKFQDDMNILKNEDLHKGLDGILKSTKLLSQTIDDFRNFFNPQKRSGIFNIKECFDKVFVLVSANLKNKEIILQTDINSIELYSHQNELIQALLNIINNAKDAYEHFESRDKKHIFITVKEIDSAIDITIKDNAGGVPEDIIKRVFEPYFTTKHQSHGTGIGLYMTKKIIESNLEGTIQLENSTFEYEGIEYKGALCHIRLPKKLKH